MSTVDLGIDHLSDAQVIGRGGFATVYAATNDLLGTRVAVKVLAPLTDEADRRRFERECRVMGRVSTHPSVVTVHHAGYSAEGRPYLVMELMEGGSLADRLRAGGPLSWAEAVDHGIAVAEALAHAHAEGILHRDVKPENILVAAGRPRLTDFGIAYLRDSTGATSASISASWLHAPPETFSNQRDERSDLYSLGSTLYQLVAGHAPFWRPGEDSLNPLLYRLVNEPPPHLPPEAAPPALDAFLQRCLAKDPAGRPSSAAACADELRAIRAGASGIIDPAATVVAPPRAPVADPPASPPTVVAPPARPAALATPESSATVVDLSRQPVDPAATVVAPVSPGADLASATGSTSGPAPEMAPAPMSADDRGAQHATGEGTGPRSPAAASGRGRRGLLLAGLGVLVAFALGAAGLALASRGGDDGDSASDTTSDTSDTSDTGDTSSAGDGSSLFSESDDGALLFHGHDDGVLGLAQLPDGRIVSASTDETVQVWNPDQPDVVPLVIDGHEGFVRGVAVLGDDRIVSASADGTARVWDLTQPDKAVTVFDGHGAEVAAVAGLGDGGGVASAGEDGRVQVWDADTGLVEATLEVGGAVRAVIGVESGPALVAGNTGGKIERWDDSDPPPTEPAASYPGSQGPINALAVFDADRFVSVGEDGVVRLWSVGDPSAPVESWPHDEPVDAVTVTTDGVIVYGDRSGTVAAWNPDTGEQADLVELDGRVRSLLALADGRLAAGTAGGDVRLWTPSYF